MQLTQKRLTDVGRCYIRRGISNLYDPVIVESASQVTGILQWPTE